MLNSGGGNEVMKLTVKKNDLRGHFSKDFSCESVYVPERERVSEYVMQQQTLFIISF